MSKEKLCVNCGVRKVHSNGLCSTCWSYKFINKIDRPNSIKCRICGEVFDTRRHNLHSECCSQECKNKSYKNKIDEYSAREKKHTARWHSLTDKEQLAEMNSMARNILRTLNNNPGSDDL